MSPEGCGTVAELARLRSEIAESRAAVRRCVEDARVVKDHWSGTTPERPYLLMAAVAVHGFYTGIENIFERAARTLDRSVPAGETWHRELLFQGTTEVPGVRPAIAPPALRSELLSLLGFRHFFRHAYGVELDPVRLGSDLDRLLRVAPKLDSALDSFDSFLAQTIFAVAGEHGNG